MKSSKSPVVRLGIVGVGAMGTNHAKSIVSGKVPRMELAAVCDLEPDRCSPFASARAFTDAGEMFRSGLIDAVLIATPHYAHTTVGIAALQAGLHVLVEKPISVHKLDGEKLIAAWEADKSRVFSAMFNQRTDPRYIKLKSLIDSGELGEIYRVLWVITHWFRTETYYRSGDWRATWGGEGGGVLLNQCPHQLDLWQWLFGMPSAVTAHCQLGRYHQIEVEDSVTAVLEYDNGAQGVFVTTTGESPGENRLTVATDRGFLVVEEDGIRFRRTESPVGQFRETSPARFSAPPTWDISIPIPGRGGQHLGVLKNFADAILDGAPLVAPASEGVHSVELANAMLMSGIEGRRVTLPLDAEHYAGLLARLTAESRPVKSATVAVTSDDLSGSF